MSKIECLNKYNIYIEKDFSKLDFLNNKSLNRLFVITDDNVSNNVFSVLKEYISKIDFFVYSISDNEKNNNEKIFNDLNSFIKDNNYDCNEDCILILGGNSVLSIFKLIYNENIKYIYIPTTLYSMIETSYGNMSNPEYVYVNVAVLSTLSDREYFNGFSYVMKNALIKDAVFYSWLIEMMYEICERDIDVIYEMIERTLLIVKLIFDKEISKGDNHSSLDFGNKIANIINEYNKDGYKSGECLSLGIVATAYISWKKNWLNKDEYYEIRDMFVPFYLPISIEMFDIEKALDLFKALYTDQNEYSFILLKKIGKTVSDLSITIDDIRNALDELNFDEAW